MTHSITCNCIYQKPILHLEISITIYIIKYFIVSYFIIYFSTVNFYPHLLFTFPICFLFKKTVLVLFWHDYICLGGLRVVLQCRSEVRRGTIRSVDRLRGAGGAAPSETDRRSRLLPACHPSWTLCFAGRISPHPAASTGPSPQPPQASAMRAIRAMKTTRASSQV